MCLLLVVNITVMSNFLGNLIQQIFSLSPFNREYDFKDHVVVVGFISEDQTFDFLEELIENDFVERSMNLIKQLAMGIKCIIVTSDDPSTSQRVKTEYLSDRYDNEIVFLRDNIFSSYKKWYKKANLLESKVLFCFSSDLEDKDAQYAMDQLMSITAKNVKDAFPQLRVHLILNSEFKHQLDQDPFFQDIETISQRKLNEYIMASSLENPGLATTL